MESERVFLASQSEEVNELEAVLASRAFVKSPNLGKILRFICTCALEGKLSELKEYNLATQALGRDVSFDPAHDSIVRVEVTRLRKRLREYYATEGAARSIQIQLSDSGYIPRFVRSPASDPPPVCEPEILLPVVKRGMIWRFAIAAFGFILLVVIAIVSWSRHEAVSSRAPSVPKPSSYGSAVLPANETRVLAGATIPRYVDSSGHVWRGDAFYFGGLVIHHPERRIFRTLDPFIYQNARYGHFRYDVPMPRGVYELHLYFAEIINQETLDSGTEAYRKFNVTVNGSRLLTDFDVVLDSAGLLNAADERVFLNITPLADGMVHLAFESSNDEALLCGFSLLPGKPGVINPVRILAGQHVYIDSADHFWDADKYFLGGRVIAHTDSVRGTEDTELYRSDRFGNFNYAIPVAPGRYTARLYFAESNFGIFNFGARQASKDGSGNRLFDILCNGVALIRSLDIAREAGGPDVAFQKTFHGLTPNAQGKLVISFIPVIDYATVRAIEIIPQG